VRGREEASRPLTHDRCGLAANAVGSFYAKCDRCRLRLGRPGRGRQVLLEDFARRAVAESAARGVVEPIGEPAEVGARERLGLTVARQEAADAAVRVLDRAFLPGGVRVAEVGLHRDRGARISEADALTPIPVRAHATRTESGRPSSSIRFRARAAMATSVARPGSVRERKASPITRL